MKNLNIAIAAFSGALVGATIALLFAPAKGADTRAKIKAYLKEKGIKLNKHKLNQVVDEIADEIAGTNV
jgi:gas vesicle protein